MKGAGGMGNRMLAAAGAVLYGTLSSRRLVIDWSDGVYSSDGRNVFHGLFAAPAGDPMTRVAETDDVVPSFWRGRLHADVDTLTRDGGGRLDPALERRSRLDLGCIDHPERVAVFWAYGSRLRELRPHVDARLPALAALSDAELLGMVLRDALPLAPAIRERVRAFRQRWLRSPTVGVHVRYGDHRVSLRAILARVGELVRRDPVPALFLATDNAEVLAAFRRVHPAVIATPHRYGAPGVPLHLDPDCPDRAAGAVEALVDMYLLAACDVLVLDTTSSFAAVAMLLAGLPQSAVHDVARRPRKPSRRRRQILYGLWMRTGMLARAPRMLARIATLRSRR